MSSMEGWLVKKNRDRYFILKGPILYWFTFKENANNDLPSTARGSLNLSNCTLNQPDRPQTIKITAPLEVYVMKGKSDEEVDHWYNALSVAIGEAKNEIFMDKIKSGFLEKNHKRRFFILRGSILQWYLHEQYGKPLGTIDLKGCHIGPLIDNNSFVLSVPYLNNRQIRLTCLGSTNEANGWLKAIREAIDSCKKEELSRKTLLDVDDDIHKEGWLEKKGRKRFFKLHNHNLTWYDEDPKMKQMEMNGTLNLKGCTVVQTGFSFTIKPTVGISYTLKALNESDVTEWVSAVHAASVKVLSIETQKVAAYDITKREGWVIKKGVGKVVGQQRRQLKRWLKIDTQTSTLKYYESDMAGVPRGEIHLAGCRLNRFDEKTFIVQTGHGRDYPFECAEVVEVDCWMKSIQYYIIRAESEIQKIALKYQWLVGGRAQGDRWVAITKDHFLLWSNKVLQPHEINIDSPNAVDIQMCQIEFHPELQNVFVVTAPRLNHPISFTCPDEESFKSWLDMLRAVQTGGKVTPAKVEEKHLVFGRKLKELLELEGVPIPKIVTKCTQFILANGTDTMGIFRISGQVDEIKKYIKDFDSGEDVTFGKETDVHAVAGVLKSFFRNMAEPVIPYEFYDTFLRVNNLDLATAAVSHLPKPNNDLLNYLCFFVKEMIKHVQKTSMNIENMAIVFGPNLLRTSDPDNISGLTDTPKVLKAIQFIMDNSLIIWKNSSITVSASPSTFSAPPPDLPAPPPPDILPPPSSPPPLSSPPVSHNHTPTSASLPNNQTNPSKFRSDVEDPISHLSPSDSAVSSSTPNKNSSQNQKPNTAGGNSLAPSAQSQPPSGQTAAESKGTTGKALFQIKSTLRNLDFRNKHKTTFFTEADLRMMAMEVEEELASGPSSAKGPASANSSFRTGTIQPDQYQSYRPVRQHYQQSQNSEKKV